MAERRGLVAALLTAAACSGSERCPAAPGLGLSDAACAAVVAIQLPVELPSARGNQYGDDTGAATLGHHVFFDARFSGSGNVRCATCHQTERSFQDGAPTPVGFDVSRNTPTVINAARLSWIFWDGRADSLWSQALFALENPAEMNFTRLEIAHLVAALYQPQYEAVFGPLPDLSNLSRFPARGMPGMPAFDAMAGADQDAINRVVANLGKALEAYERKATAGPSPVDEWLAGDRSQSSAQERRGLAVAARAGCLFCHSGPMLTDEGFHNLGVPAAAGIAPDEGRVAALAVLAASPFTAQGPFWDGDRPRPVIYEPSPALRGAIRTPSLRNLSRTPPYGHNGAFATLQEVVNFHLEGGGRGRQGFVGEVDALLQPVTLDADDKAALMAFLQALKGTYPPYPWADWPRG